MELQIDELDLVNICDLYPNIDQFKFKARVTKKKDIRKYQQKRNNNQEGQLFSIDVMDIKNEEMTITFFDQEVNRFFEKIQEGHTYLFSGGKIQINTNNQYNKGSNQMIANKETQIISLNEDNSIGQTKIERKQIKDISEMKKGESIDLICVVKSQEKKSITTHNKEQKMKKDIIIFDESGVEVEFQIWGEEGEHKNYQNGQIILIKQAKVGEFNTTKFLQYSYNTQVIENPNPENFKEVNTLKNWLKVNNSQDMVNISQLKSDLEGKQNENIYYEKSIRQLNEKINQKKQNNLINDDLKIWTEIRAHVVRVKDSPLYYNSCTKCNKKVIFENEQWYCQNCAQHHHSTESKYIASILISDSSSQIWVNAYDDICKSILGYSANDFRIIDGNNDTEKKKKLLQQAQYNEFRFLLLTKGEKNQDSFREKTIVMKIKNFNPVNESKNLINMINKYQELYLN